MLLQAWRRRWWRPDAAALAAYAGLRPMVVVTGGSEGIGYELARRFAGAGGDVMLVARRPEPLERGRTGTESPRAIHPRPGGLSPSFGGRNAVGGRLRDGFDRRRGPGRRGPAPPVQRS